MEHSKTQQPSIRWGVIGSGMISSWFVSDILKPDWPEKNANHEVVAIGASSLEKSEQFIEKHVVPASPVTQPTAYGSYQEVYDHPDVDCIYIGTPHSFHKQNCLDAINAGKHVLCEKPFAMNAKEAQEVFDAAKQKGVFVMEAMWTRFYPLVKKIQHLLFVEKKLGNVYRTFCDFGLSIDIPSLPASSRYKDPALGAGSLLDIGIYSLTWGIITSTDKVGEEAEDPEVSSLQTLNHGVDTSSSVLLRYLSTGKQAVCTSTTDVVGPTAFARIEGSKGTIIVHGPAPSAPERFDFIPNDGGQKEEYQFEKPGFGLFWEADAVAHDIMAGRKQNATMPWAETLRVMSIMDGVRQRGGARFPVDDW
ncbi:putative D-xylose 1-dehydrogenase (NADP(+)) [Pseudocercospora fuligena]|uniref:D-xylose 1-dehydrogenase (NADP(+), D-xylono-1,5-lactone-forming) n=1 Tax=Pseudocercospora fuligena TaxID=685502 RepID=A0A8H6RDF4_9PEZI|nr:putative D-xylose 1-dehydrogenase (NADP(+)) [Pseudocercospora fuligena]